MASGTYRKEQSIKLSKKVSDIEKRLPKFAESFFDSLYISGKMPGTIYEYAKDIDKFFDYIKDEKYPDLQDIRNIPVTDLEKYTLDDFNHYLMLGNVNQATRKRRSASIRKFYLYYYKRENIAKNPTLLIEGIKIPEHEIITLSNKEVINILDVVEKMSGKDKTGNSVKKCSKTVTRNYAVITTLLGTGIRVSELVGLDVNDVDFNENCFHIIRKGGKEDKVYFGEAVKRALNGYLVNGREIIGASKKDSTALFLSLFHNRLSVRSIDNMVREFARAAGLGEHITPHKFRSTYGTNLYAETGDIYLVADALGHSSVETTRKHYTKMGESHKKLAADVSSDLFLDDAARKS